MSPECNSLLGVSRRLEDEEEDQEDGPLGPALPPSFGVRWGNNTDNALLSNVTGLVEKAKSITTSMKERVDRIEGTVNRIESKLEAEFPDSAGKSGKEPPSASGDTESNRLLQMDHLDDAGQALTLNERLDRVEKHVMGVDKKLDRLVELVSIMLEKDEEEQVT